MREHGGSRRDPAVAGQREIESSSEADAVYNSDRGDAEICDPAHKFLAAPSELSSIVRIDIRYLTKIRSGRKHIAGSREDQRVDISNPRDDGVHLLENPYRQRTPNLGSCEVNDGVSPALFDFDGVRHFRCRAK